MSKIPYVLDVPEDALLADCRGPCCTGGDGAPLFFDGGGLCCPDDLLDTVMGQLDDGFLEALGIEVGAPPPPPPRQEPPAGRGGYAVESESVPPDDAGADGVAAMECGAEDFCRGLFPFPMDAGSGGGLQACGDGAPLLPAHEVGGFSPLTDAGMDGGLHTFGGGAPPLPAHDLCSFFPVDMVLPDADSDGAGVHASGVGAPQLPAAHGVGSLFPVDTVPTDARSAGGLHAFGDGAPQLPPHTAPVSLAPPHAAPMLLSARSADTTAVSSAGCQPSTIRETEWRPPIFLLQLDFVVPRKKRNRPANRRTNQSWSPHFLLNAARNNNPISTTSGDDAGEHKAGNDGGEHSGGNDAVGGGVVRRRPVPRPRNRQSQRVCSHCERSDTPQWRAGPEGPGTLCNAMGKLLDEYRPSTSPSFQSDKHSNRHRKVIKLREQKAKKDAPKLMDATSTVPTMVAAYMSASTCQ